MYDNPDEISINGVFSLNGNKGLVVDKAGSRLDNVQTIFEDIKRLGILCDAVKVHIVQNGTTTSLTKVQVVKNGTTTVVWEKSGWATTWTGSSTATMAVTTGTTGASDGTNTWYSGTSTKTYSIADGYIKNTTSKTRITVTVDGTEKTIVLTSSDQLIGSGTSTELITVKTKVYARLDSSGIVITTSSQATMKKSKAVPAVVVEITKIEQYS